MASRTGPSGRGRHTDPQRSRRGSSLPPLGTGLVYDSSDRIMIEPGRSLNDLKMTISAAPTQAEVQAVSDKVDELMAILRDTNQISR